MASCLGLYIENNLIKYAKVSKNNNESAKVESFGVKFYDNVESAIKQIIEETYSFKIPISINLSEEIYNKFEVFSLLSKKDIDGVINSEFENLCYDKDENPNIYESRYIIANSNAVRNEKVTAIHISSTKASIAQQKNRLSEYKVTSIVPLGICIQNLLKEEKKTASLIVNIEKNTTITKVYNNAIADIKVIQTGAHDIIDNIERKENSYSKAYEICKNTTIYTEKDKDLQYEENEYLVDIMPVLYQIVTEVSRIAEESIEKIEKVYITGTGAIINNIDIYFQDYLRNIRCEILKPAFVSSNSKINIKDYIEVNSAISIALQGLEKNNNINFIKESKLKKTFSFLKMDLSKGNGNTASTIIDNFINKFNKQYYATVVGCGLIVIGYLVGAIVINNQLETKISQANSSIDETNTRMAQIEEYNTQFNSQITEYQRLIRNIENINDANSEDKRYRNTIPNLLNNIMAVIPKSVQLSSIENTSNTHIVIKAYSAKSEQIAYFKKKLDAEEILKDVVSDTGVLQGGSLSVTIEGELPWKIMW